MPAMNKDLLHQGFNFATACFDAGLDATPLTTWLSEQARLGMAPIAGSATGIKPGSITYGPGTRPTQGNFDEATLTAIQSSSNGVTTADLAPILKHWGRPANQIGASLGRLKRHGKIEQKGDLWVLKKASAGKVDRSLVKSQQTRRRGRPANTGTPATGEQQPLAATG